MGVQPIDLQTMYSQMANVAQRVSGETQGAALAQSIQQQGIINQELRRSQTVQRAAGNEAETGKVKSDSRGNSPNQSYGGKKKNQNPDTKDEKKEYEIRDPLLGQRINVTG